MNMICMIKIKNKRSKKKFDCLLKMLSILSDYFDCYSLKYKKIQKLSRLFGTFYFVIWSFQNEESLYTDGGYRVQRFYRFKFRGEKKSRFLVTLIFTF